MPIFPVRDLASKGILRDPSPYQLDLNAWSNGKGVRFHANKAQSGPIFRSLQGSLSVEPVHVTGYEPSSGFDAVFVTGADGSTSRFQSGTTSDVSANKSVGAISITAGGSYTPGSPPGVTFSAATGSGAITATGTAIMTSGGVVTGILMTNTGYYPTGVAPTVSFTTGSATATCVLGYSTTADPRAVTDTFLGDVQYINHPSRPPQFFTPLSTQFSNLPYMECPWTCRSLRAFGDYLIALNVTKPSTFTDPHTGATTTGGSLPNLFKWSTIAFDAQVPLGWDPADPTLSSGENPLEQLTSPLVDGLPMRNLFVIYSETEIWAAEQTGTNSVFQWQQLFSNGGMIAPNCVVEVDGVHYVFGPTDIYKHDGTTKVSIVDKRNRETIFRNLNKHGSEAFFVRYIPHLDSIAFCYQTGDSNFTFTNTDRCNALALYDIANDTWAFDDLPNVGGMCMANVDATYTYASVPSTFTYANFGGSYYDQQNTFRKSCLAVSGQLSGKITQHRLLGWDFATNGWLPYAFEPECNTPAYLERTGIALDQLGSDLETYKRLRRIMPLVSISNGVPIQIQIGYSNTPSGAVTWGPILSFNPTTQYKVDTITGGRYLAIRFTVPTPVDFEVAGFDCDVTSGGRR